ncbi:ATP-dependent DNA helicase RecG [Candidatus Saccharibacteria bacterium]|nr:ATP-dependent DNA helicase RecG [Candidatus Saccharibacteria bacterium]
MNLFEPVEELRGIGDKTAATLAKYGIKTIRDLFYNLPRDYENYGAPLKIKDIHPGKIIVKGKIKNLTTRRAKRRNLSVTEGIIDDGTGEIKVIWFNQSYRAKQFTEDREYYFTGNYELKNGRFSLMSPSAALATDIDPRSGLNPVYVAHGPLKSHDFKRLINNSRDKFAATPDLLPTVKPKTRADALFKAHFPTSIKDAETAREYLAYEELFELILAARLNKNEISKLKSQKIPFELEKFQEFLKKLPFNLTDAQKKATWEILQDMERATPMNRLLQGDVGSGKTIVAAAAAYDAISSGAQVAILAPTAILATQHYEKLKPLFEEFRIATALLTGATKDKTSIKQAIKQGKINIVIGTHALLTDDTEFDNLALVIIDEQHRFGVEQRQKLLLKSPKDTAPHLLAMTATPIPRSLQLTVFGDLDISIISQLPKGRQPITTKILREIDNDQHLYPKMHEYLAKNQQIYWICKAIDDNPREETTSVKSRYDKLTKRFPHHKVAFLHGRMKPAEKDSIMADFAAGKTDILVSTTVVEVGVDVPNANLIIIENAERYGLAQLHQLRGRVGRGQSAATCLLLTPGDDEPTRRLKELEKSTDGFYLAEVDLKIRGPGEIYGALQHGALDLRIVTLSDTKLIARARHDVDQFLQNPENMLKYKELAEIITKYQQLTTLN